MSWDSDRDHSDWLNDQYERPDHTCADCGAGFWSDAVGDLCNACLDQRDAHASALELRMAKADLVARNPLSGNPDNPAVVDVALVPIVQPAGYLGWLDGLRANAAYGSDALARAWYIAPTPYIQHLITVAPDLWTTLQAIARRQAA